MGTGKGESRPSWSRAKKTLIWLRFPLQPPEVLALRGVPAQPRPTGARGAPTTSSAATAATTTALEHCSSPHPTPLGDQEVQEGPRAPWALREWVGIRAAGPWASSRDLEPCLGVQE